MRFRKVFLLLVMFCLPLAALADSGVLLLLKDGTTVGLTFSQKPKMVMGDELRLIADDGSELSYPYADVQRAYWDDVEATGIGSVANVSDGRHVVFRHTADGIEVTGLQKGGSVSVYGIDGTLVSAASAHHDNDALQLSLPAGHRAVYIVRTSTGISYKLLH